MLYTECDQTSMKFLFLSLVMFMEMVFMSLEWLFDIDSS